MLRIELDGTGLPIASHLCPWTVPHTIKLTSEPLIVQRRRTRFSASRTTPPSPGQTQLPPRRPLPHPLAQKKKMPRRRSRVQVSHSPSPIHNNMITLGFFNTLYLSATSLRPLLSPREENQKGYLSVPVGIQLSPCSSFTHSAQAFLTTWRSCQSFLSALDIRFFLALLLGVSSFCLKHC